MTTRHHDNDIDDNDIDDHDIDDHDIDADALEAGLFGSTGGGSDGGTERAGSAGGRRRRTVTNRWMRWVHVYASMVSFVVVLFFGITGLTVNHPEWTFGDDVDRTSHAGTLPADFRTADAVDFLVVSEYIRAEYGVSGHVTDHGLAGNDGTISYKAPGYAADLFFDVDSGAYTLEIEQQGVVGVFNDLHKGRDAPRVWKWVIDASAVFLVLVALTGLGIQVCQRKRRTRALVFASAGLVLTVVLILLALR